MVIPRDNDEDVVKTEEMKGKEKENYIPEGEEDEVCLFLFFFSFSFSSYIRFQENHGILSEDHSEIYYLGIIDFLQRYDVGKKAERFTKVVLLQKDSKVKKDK